MNSASPVTGRAGNTPVVPQKQHDVTAAIEATSNPRLRQQQQQIQKSFEERKRKEAAAAAQADAFARIPRWMFYLNITPFQKFVLGRIYSFQCTKNKDGQPNEFRMSPGNLATELNDDRENVRHALRKLLGGKYLAKTSNGPRRPATYRVDELICLEEARRNGWKG